MALKVGELYALLRLDDSEFKKKMAEARAGWEETGKRLEGIGKKLSLGVSLPLLGMGAGALAAGRV